MGIEIADRHIVHLIESGEAVFKITTVPANNPVCEHDYAIVTTRDEYLRKLHSHQYNPLLFAVDIYTRLAYLYGCLNVEFATSRSDIYIFYWRTIGSDTWHVWFRVLPYIDNLNTGVTQI